MILKYVEYKAICDNCYCNITEYIEAKSKAEAKKKMKGEGVKFSHDGKTLCKECSQECSQESKPQ